MWLLELTKSLGLPALTLAVSVLAVTVSASAVAVSVLIARWQGRIAREKLRQDLYDRRFAVYMAFHELLVAIVEKNDVEHEIRNANAARAHSPFLLDPQLGAYLEQLGKEAFRINASTKLVRDERLGSPADRALQASQLGQDKLTLINQIDVLVREFERFLRLDDFTRS